jgi:S-adenosyl methyltransferase
MPSSGPTWMTSDSEEEWIPVDLHLEKAHSARMYDYYLDGKTNYAADREAAGAVVKVFPGVKRLAHISRGFMHRATRELASRGVSQFLDIGTGIPTSPNLHEVAQGVLPHARVVYADNDPIVLAHAQALLASTPEGRTAYIQADAKDPESILNAKVLAETLDLTKPVAVSMNALFHFFPDEFDPYGIVERLMSAMPSGSYLGLSHCTGDFDAETWERIIKVYYESGTPFVVRTEAEVERLFQGLEFIEGGVQLAHVWGTEPDPEGPTDAEVSLYAAVARKP